MATNKTYKPSWLNAPKWAKYLAKDESGEWWWFENKPIFESKSKGDMWAEYTGRAEPANTDTIPYNKSLEQRPEEEAR